MDEGPASNSGSWNTVEVSQREPWKLFDPHTATPGILEEWCAALRPGALSRWDTRAHWDAYHR